MNRISPKLKSLNNIAVSRASYEKKRNGNGPFSATAFGKVWFAAVKHENVQNNGSIRFTLLTVKRYGPGVKCVSSTVFIILQQKTVIVKKR